MPDSGEGSWNAGLLTFAGLRHLLKYEPQEDDRPKYLRWNGSAVIVTLAL
jgi:hypothetical protein